MSRPVPKTQLTPTECHQRLCHLSSQAEDLSINSIISKLCHILMIMDQGKSYVMIDNDQYPTRLRIWNSKLVNKILAVLKEILTNILNMMHENDLKTLKFSPSNLEIGANNVIKFTSKIYAKYVSMLLTCDVRKSLEEQTTDFGRVLAICYNMLNILACEIKFEKYPSVSNTSSPLWNKLHREESVLSLLEKNSFPVCPMCFANELKEDGNFAITDCCTHLVCATCAKKVFNVRSYQESLCPFCHLPVSAWTDSRHFHRFKTSRQVQTKVWLAARRIMSALP